ncbi:MAG: hypothetical protein NW217_06240 [Hyphomicrobiaceae bacterium]|nr:hypothetical protein [Hyphomicrobiaceae bacterium]
MIEEPMARHADQHAMPAIVRTAVTLGAVGLVIGAVYLAMVRGQALLADLASFGLRLCI